MSTKSTRRRPNSPIVDLADTEADIALSEAAALFRPPERERGEFTASELAEAAGLNMSVESAGNYAKRLVRQGKFSIRRDVLFEGRRRNMFRVVKRGAA